MSGVRRLWRGVAITVGLACPLASQAAMCDLTTANASCTINTAIYQEGDFILHSSGTGIFPSFVQIGEPGGSVSLTQGYNTTFNNVLNNGSADQHNHEVLLSTVPI